MKKKNFKTYHTLILATAVFFCGFCSSCKKKSDDPAPVAVTKTVDTTKTPVDTNLAYTGVTGMVSFHLHTFIDQEEVDGYTYVYTTTEGRKISLDLAQLYLYKVTLIKDDGSTYTIKDTVKLKTIDFESYMIGNAPIGSYKSVKFNVGLSPAVNASAANSNKILNHPEMWFGTNAQPDGYVFAHIEGKIDTTTAMDATDAQMVPFKYLIGTNANLNTVVMPVQKFTIAKDQNTFIHMYIDYSQIFNGLQLNNSQNLTMTSAADNATVLGQKLKNNIPKMFRYEN
jgi:hypothetical protein